MSEIEIGEYVRLKSGHIVGKAIGIVPEHGDETGYCPESVNTEELDTIFYDEIAKHSKNIIDLIEIGDIVNGYKILDIADSIYENSKRILIYKNEKEKYERWIYIQQYNGKVHTQDDIKTILTKEQYNQNCYRLEGIKCLMQ